MIYRWPPADEDSPPQLTASFVHEDASWWSGVQQCGATLALSVALALSASQAAIAQQVFSYHQDDPAGNLTATVDEYFWQNPVAPVGGYVPPQQLWIYDEQIPAGNLSATVDEYFGFTPTFQAQYPVPQLAADDSLIVPQPVAFQPDEDFWNNPVQPYVAQIIVPQAWNFDEQVPVLFGQFDEDFWQNPVPIAAAYSPPQSFSSDEIIVPQPVSFQPDEDFWINPVPVTIVPMVQMAYYLFDAGDIVPQPVAGTKNYVNQGVNNYISQRTGEGVEF